MEAKVRASTRHQFALVQAQTASCYCTYLASVEGRLPLDAAFNIGWTLLVRHPAEGLGLASGYQGA